jgi:hypothetical protein
MAPLKEYMIDVDRFICDDEKYLSQTEIAIIEDCFNCGYSTRYAARCVEQHRGVNYESTA